jgi:MFS family permease
MAAAENESVPKPGLMAPLKVPVFRNIWCASVLGNFGQLILGVGAAWEMTRLTNSPGMVALVQSALMLPLMLVALPAGAVADMFDRRRIAMAGLAFSIVAASALTFLAFGGHAGPWVLLAFCSLIGAGVALYTPAWQASVSEQVPVEDLPAAISLSSISYNLARSFGPAVGGLIVIAAGAGAAFATNAVAYVPLLLAFFVWKRRHVPSRLPPERMGRAIFSGMRYAFHASAIRKVLVRAFLFGLCGATMTALAPLIARDLLQGDAGTYGLLLGWMGAGAVLGAMIVGPLRDRLGTETAVRVLAVAGGLSIATCGISHSIVLTSAALFVAGACNILTIALFNISVQLSAPRWVTARALSLFSSALTGGIAIGAALWGVAAGRIGLPGALYLSGALLLVLPLVGLLLPISDDDAGEIETVALAREPEVAIALTLRSGPIVVELDYDVAAEDARAFYDAMCKVQRIRLRNGGFAWSIARDIGNPDLWTERFQCPTWGDYLRMRDRFTQVDLALHAAARAYHRGEGELTIRRKLERPFGSVRWQSDTPDPRQDGVAYLAP